MSQHGAFVRCRSTPYHCLKSPNSAFTRLNSPLFTFPLRQKFKFSKSSIVTAFGAVLDISSPVDFPPPHMLNYVMHSHHQRGRSKRACLYVTTTAGSYKGFPPCCWTFSAKPSFPLRSLRCIMMAKRSFRPSSPQMLPGRTSPFWTWRCQVSAALMWASGSWSGTPTSRFL